MTKLYLLCDENHEGAWAIHGVFSTLANLEAYQHKARLGKVMTTIGIAELDKPEEFTIIPQIIRFSKKLEDSLTKHNPNAMEQALARCTTYCDDCQKKITACWECGFYHCKCNK